MINPYNIETLLGSRLVQTLFKHLTKEDKEGNTLIDGVLESYFVGRYPASVLKRLQYLPLGFLVGVLAKLMFKVNKRDDAVAYVMTDPISRKALRAVMRSVAEFGLTHPQIFSAPLLVVWNLTDVCNLRCQHCYQNAGAKTSPDELGLEQQMEVVDQLDENDVPFLAFSGGEPIMAENFWQVAGHAKRKGMYISVATNGTLLTKEVVARMADIGIDYVEISLDSSYPEVHDRFRGMPGAWERTVEGIKNAAAQDGIEVGVASTITRLNFYEMERLIQFAIDLGADCFYAFNFIPTGRAKGIVDMDLTPQMREEMLRILYKHYIEDITTMSACPQYGRVCMMESDSQVVVTSHYSLGKGETARMMARYIGGCGAGRAYCAIQPNGVVTPCVFMQIPVGDLKEEALSDIWHNSPVLNTLRDRNGLSEHCRVCRYRDYCGGCRARAYGYFGDITGPDPGCINNLRFWEGLLLHPEPSRIHLPVGT